MPITRSPSRIAKTSRRSRARIPRYTGVIPRNVGQSEIKFDTVPLTTSFSSISSAQTAVELTAAVVGGYTLVERIGRQINLLNVRLFGTLVQGVVDGIADDRYNVVRIVLATHSAGNAPTIPLSTPISRSNTRYLEEVLYDKTVVLYSPAPDSTGYLPAIKHIDRTIPVNRKFNYYSHTGGATPIELSLIMVSDSAAVPNPGFVQGSWTVTFTDE